MTTPSTTTTDRANQLISGLRAEGYSAIPPTRDAGRDAALDQEACRQLRCHACGKRGLAWSAFWRGASHVAVCACPACGDAALA